MLMEIHYSLLEFGNVCTNLLNRCLILLLYIKKTFKDPNPKYCLAFETLVPSISLGSYWSLDLFTLKHNFS